MIQHINLLRSERSARRDAIQLAPVLAACAVALLMVGAGGLYLRDRLADTQARAQQARAKTQERIAASNATRALDDQLSRELTQSRARLARLERTAEQLKDIEVQPSLPFSQLLDALARRSLDGVWLIGLVAESADQRLTIAARATAADRVPAYLKQLNQEPLLRERRFQAMELVEQELVPGLRVVEFRLSTSPIGKGGS